MLRMFVLVVLLIIGAVLVINAARRPRPVTAPDGTRKGSALHLLLVAGLVVLAACLVLFLGLPAWLWLLAALLLVVAALFWFFKWVTYAAVMFICCISAMLLLFIFGFSHLFPTSSAQASANGGHKSTVTTRNPSPGGSTGSPANCPTWAYKADAHKDGNFLSGGLASIWKVQSNPSDEQAKAAANDWIEQMKLAPENLQFADKTVLNQDVATADLQSNGCATATAASYVTQLHDKINSAKVTVEAAPADGYNTGVQNGTGVVESQSGVTGDRTAIKVVLDDGRTFWVMARCANVVFQGSPPTSIPTTTSPVSTPPVQHTTPPPAPRTTTPPQQTTPPVRTTTGGKTASQMHPPVGGSGNNNNVGGTSTEPSRPTTSPPQQTVDPSQPTGEVSNPVNTVPPAQPTNTGDPGGA